MNQVIYQLQKSDQVFHQSINDKKAISFNLTNLHTDEIKYAQFTLNYDTNRNSKLIQCLIIAQVIHQIQSDQTIQNIVQSLAQMLDESRLNSINLPLKYTPQWDDISNTFSVIQYLEKKNLYLYGAFSLQEEEEKLCQIIETLKKQWNIIKIGGEVLKEWEQLGISDEFICKQIENDELSSYENSQLEMIHKSIQNQESFDLRLKREKEQEQGQEQEELDEDDSNDQEDQEEEVYQEEEADQEEGEGDQEEVDQEEENEDEEEEEEDREKFYQQSQIYHEQLGSENNTTNKQSSEKQILLKKKQSLKKQDLKKTFNSILNEKEARDKINDLQRLISERKLEFKELCSTFQKYDEQSDLITQKCKNLNKVLKEQEDIIERMYEKRISQSN